jgi:hypothetical protein
MRAIVEKRHEGRFNEWEGPPRCVWAVVRVDRDPSIIVARATSEAAASELVGAINAATSDKDAAHVTSYWHDTGRIPPR